VKTVDETDVVAHINGELVVRDAAGRLAFERLQNRLAQRGAGATRAAEEWPAHFVAFDLLRLSGTDTTGWPYRRRRATLESVFAARRLIAPWTLCPSTTDADTVREWLTWASVGMEGVLRHRSGAGPVSPRPRPAPRGTRPPGAVMTPPLHRRRR
jgi:ATP-dependent DNA ligase